MPQKFESISLDGLPKVIASRIIEAIFEGQLKPGEKIVEQRLSEQMQVSRAPIREALRQLEERGLVYSIPRKGTFVSNLTAEDIEEIFDLRMFLEGKIMRHASKHFTEADEAELRRILDKMNAAAEAGNSAQMVKHDLEFHRYIWHLSRCRYLEKIMEQLCVPYFFSVMRLATDLFVDLRQIYHDHQYLLKLLKKATPEEAERKTVAFYRKGKKPILDFLRKAAKGASRSQKV